MDGNQTADAGIAIFGALFPYVAASIQSLCDFKFNQLFCVSIILGTSVRHQGAPGYYSVCFLIGHCWDDIGDVGCQH
jgi:hypothetical protein